MVQGIPYVHWKINGREYIDYDNVDINYLWATVVESSKGPINTPVLCGSNNDVLNLFGVNLAPYFAQGAEYLIVIRAAAQSDDHSFKYPSKQITNAGTFEYQEVAQPYYVGVDNEYSFASYGDVDGTIHYANGTVKTTGVVDEDFAQVLILDQDAFTEEGFVGTKFFIQSNAQVGSTLYELYESTSEDKKGNLVSGIWIQILSNDSIDAGPKKYVLNGQNKIFVNKVPGQSYYKKCDETTGKILDDNTTYTPNEVSDLKEAYTRTIEDGEPLIELTTKYPGAYNVTLVLHENIIYSGYDIVLTEQGAGYLSINNVSNLSNIVNTINNAELSVTASLTPKGEEVVKVMDASPVVSEEPYANVAVGQILAKADGTRYEVKLNSTEDAPAFEGGSNGEWDEAAGRVSSTYAVAAHKEALAVLQNIRLAGIFCLYGEDEIQREYLMHGSNSDNDYFGMNNNYVCKWREIIVGANAYDREDVWSLKQKAQSINNEYVLFLGQGLIENNTQLLPYQCTPYVAGLRARLNYGDSIFGGQTRKRITPVGNQLKVAPLFAYEDEKTTLVWQPLVYQDLNESGVLTFTTEYGGLTLLDGVTTAQNDSKQETEEGVISILKYIQNNVQLLCLGYIGRNINTDSEASLKMNIKTFLETMVTQDRTLIELPDEGLSAYEVDVVMAPRSSQTIGKINVYLKVTPVHALRQIEVEMTVQ